MRFDEGFAIIIAGYILCHEGPDENKIKSFNCFRKNVYSSQTLDRSQELSIRGYLDGQ
jgi:hypothetical protein